MGRQLVPATRQALETASASLEAAEASLDQAESSLDDAIRVASEASREAMDRTYGLYRASHRSFSAANSRYRYHAARCSWWSPGHCGARNYWRGIRGARLAQRNARWRAYTAARAVYQNREYLENNPAVNSARATMDEARAAFNAARTEVDRLETTLASMQDWMDSYEACASCDRPSLPVQVTSAEAEAALEGFFGRSQVELAVGYRCSRIARSSGSCSAGRCRSSRRPSTMRYPMRCSRRSPSDRLVTSLRGVARPVVLCAWLGAVPLSAQDPEPDSAAAADQAPDSAAPGETAEAVLDARLSPDGRRVAFRALEGPSPRLFVRGALDSLAAPRALTPADLPVGTYRWAPDGRWLVLQARAAGVEGRLYVVSVDPLAGADVPDQRRDPGTAEPLPLPTRASSCRTRTGRCGSPGSPKTPPRR
ncbi:MAG: hypothetical protein U5R14_14920 [Gemmatimonadota bacterium]|nr:hypothetical protein [Gemmatimonadota bacterium]